MTFRMYMLFMGFATTLSWFSWIVVVWGIDPVQAGSFSFALFYVTLFLSLIGSFTLAGVVYRILVLRRSDILSREVRISFRHSILLSVVAVVSLALSAQPFFRWSIFIPVLLIVSGVEYVFLLGDASHRT